jgi:hypothetical protein
MEFQPIVSSVWDRPSDYIFYFPRPDTIKLNHSLLIHIDEVCGPRRHGHEAALAHFTGLGLIGSVTHA